MITQSCTWPILQQEAFIFDMDGVLLDSERLYIECCVEAAARLDMKNIVETCHRCIGVTTEVTRKILVEAYQDEELVSRFTAMAVDIYRQKYQAGLLTLKPGVTELLRELKNRNWKTAVASSTATDIVRKELKDAGVICYFDEIIGGDQVSRSKPNPDIFLKAAEKLGTLPGQCVVIEDSFNGIRAAKAAGMTAIMVPDQLQPDEEIRRLADCIVNSLNDVRKMLN